ncbi:hypothetical protein FLX27_03530 [Agrobacterium tumefaciens]|nr:hypothetical protein FLX27_03530 [Agrobacterium tumefaciens]
MFVCAQALGFHAADLKSSLFERERNGSSAVIHSQHMEDNMLKGIALWAMGVPIFVIILLYMFVF